MGISWEYHGNIMGISWEYHGDMTMISWVYIIPSPVRIKYPIVWPQKNVNPLLNPLNYCFWRMFDIRAMGLSLHSAAGSKN